jgi:4-methoxybenzoate monooxygenase (O-demethylating)
MAVLAVLAGWPGALASPRRRAGLRILAGWASLGLGGPMAAGTGEALGCARSDIDPFSDDFLADPFPLLSELRDAGPVVYLDRYGVLAVSRHEQVQAVLREPRVYSSAAGVGITNIGKENPWRKPSILLEVDPPLHSRNRKVVARALAPRSLAYLQETFDRRAAELADELAARRTFDAVPDLAEVFPTQVFPEAFGIQENGRDQLLAYGAMVFNGHGPRNHLFEASMAGGQRVIGWITEQCLRSSLRADGLAALIYEAADANGVTEDDAALLVRSFLSAGLDTTVSALALGVLDFVRFPGQWQALREDPSLARNAFEEVVRLESPVIGFFRTTSQPVQLAGTALPADAKLLVFFAGANRDPRRWQRPDHFDIRRKVAGHMGYGTGVHNCVGQVIARMEGEALFRALAPRIRSWHLAGQPRPRLNNTLRGLDSLPVDVDVA